jgi:anti-sigma regulatory factor (Ser/Thr protein kinase)
MPLITVCAHVLTVSIPIMGTPSAGKPCPPEPLQPMNHGAGNHLVHGARMVAGAMDTWRTVGAALPAVTRFAGGGMLLDDPVRFGTLSLPVPDKATGWAAREMVRVALTSWGLNRLCDDVQLCVSELVGNAAHHSIPDNRIGRPPAGHTVVLTLRAWPGLLFVEVADEDSSPPTLPIGEAFGPDFAQDLPEALVPDRGRGLHIVRSLTDYLWWVPRDRGGKSVFCRFDLSGVAV